MLSRLPLYSPCAFAAVFVTLALAGVKKDVEVTDPAQAGPDFAVQGEYAGKLAGKEGQQEYGAQVIALGDAKFDLVLFTGGLPGAELGSRGDVVRWKRGDESTTLSGATNDEGVTTFAANTLKAAIKDGAMTFSGDVSGTLKKVERKSPTLAAKPPEGAVVLFDGSSADAFLRGKMTEDGHLMADCETKQKFGDHTLHIEFRTPFKPFARGQARGNSGVYIQNRYECQVLDSFGLEGKNNECGGIYSIAEPIVNACFPPLSWQTYDMDFTAARYDDAGAKTANARVTIRHNGILIHDNLELPKGTPGKNPEGPGPDGIYLQGHGNPVVYRNIWVVEK